MRRLSPIPVIDLFAGPGGLGEGFAALDHAGHRAFRIALSIEKDAAAHKTLLLRAFFRQFEQRKVPETYYRFVRGELTQDELESRHWPEFRAARHEAWHLELGADEAGRSVVHRRIEAALCDDRGGRHRDWVLIGGPPCQAFSLAGRARNRGVAGWSLDTDARHTLYLEYLRIIADHEPAVFVMENVKGLLSAKVSTGRVLETILADLSDPGRAFGSRRRSRYSLHSITTDTKASVSGSSPLPEDFIVRCERYGVPQARHRLIIVGIRDDRQDRPFGRLTPASSPVSVKAVLGDLPRLRSGLSSRDSVDAWKDWIRSLPKRPWFAALKRSNPQLASAIRRQCEGAELPSLRKPDGRSRGGDAFAMAAWFNDGRLDAVLNHESRGHMAEDLDRYMFAACSAAVTGRSPRLSDYPAELLPRHGSAAIAVKGGGYFDDRFRVQVAGLPATTVVSHIAKDGHYYIHYDPTQCRSLTVREAARLQTFPDNYAFLGNRTEQYTQVGNAVPPYMARQIASVVHDFLKGARA